MPGRYDLQIGRMSFVSAKDSLQEQLGDPMASVGAQVVAGDRAARAFQLTIPVYGASGDTDPYATGNRLRRQLRSLMENAKVRSEALYTKVSFDPEMTGWVMFGQSNLAYGEGGVSLADYELQVGDAFLVAKARTHRLARRVDVADRRSTSVAADIESREFSPFWPAGYRPVLALPTYMSDLMTQGPTALGNLITRMGAEGPIPLFAGVDGLGALDGAVVHGEQDQGGPTARANDCVIFDRQGNTALAPNFRTNLHTTPRGQSLSSLSTAGPTPGSIGLQDLVDGAAPPPLLVSDGVVVDTAVKQVGAAGQDRSYDGIALISGQTYTFSMWVWLEANTAVGVRLQVRTSSDVVVASGATHSTVGGWTRLSVSYTAANTATYRFGLEQNAAGATTVYWTGALVERVATVGSFFDGESQWARWTGARYVSTSERVTDPIQDQGWEEVYGPDYPLTAGDVPTLQTGLTRTRYDPANHWFRIDQFVAGTGWVERATLIPQASGGAMTALVGAWVVEWTPERAVVRARFARGASPVIDVYVIVQRGWSGPRFEVYSRVVAQTGGLLYVPNDAGAMVAFADGAFNTTNNASVKPSDQGTWDATSVSLIAPLYNVLGLVPVAGGFQHNLMQGQRSTDPVAKDDATAYGATRKAIRFISPSAAGSSMWQSMDVRYLATPAAVLEAETYMLAGGTRTSVADAAASGGNAINDTQTAATANTLQGVPVLSGVATGVWVRVRTVTAGDTVSVRAVAGASTSSSVATTSNTYTWVWVELTPTATTLAIQAWRSSGTGAVRVDRIVVVPLSATGDLSGTREVAGITSADARGVQELVAR